GVHGGLSANDYLAVRSAIRQETSEPILKIDGDGASGVTVQTGRVGNGLNGSGHVYHMNQTGNGWQIVHRESWMSASPNKPAAGNAGFRLAFQIGHSWPGVPEPER